MSMQDHMMQSLKHQAEKIEDLESRLAKAVEALRKARPCVERVWDETKGTEREGTAMGAADTLQSINEALSELKGEAPQNAGKEGE